MTSAGSSRRIFMTGGTGYLGARLIPLLIGRGHQVSALVRSASASRLPSAAHRVEGNALDRHTFSHAVRGSDTFIQLVGVPKPAPWKGAAFRAVDRVSALASIGAAREAAINHFVYVSVAHPAPVMKDYIAVRAECEAVLRASGLRTTIIRPWYILGPGHWWPLLLKPGYWICEHLASTRDSGLRLGLVTVSQVLATLVWAVEHPPESEKVVEVPEIRTIGNGSQ